MSLMRGWRMRLVIPGKSVSGVVNSHRAVEAAEERDGQPQTLSRSKLARNRVQWSVGMSDKWSFLEVFIVCFRLYAFFGLRERLTFRDHAAGRHFVDMLRK